MSLSRRNFLRAFAAAGAALASGSFASLVIERGETVVLSGQTIHLNEPLVFYRTHADLRGCTFVISETFPKGQPFLKAFDHSFVNARRSRFIPEADWQIEKAGSEQCFNS